MLLYGQNTNIVHGINTLFINQKKHVLYKISLKHYHVFITFKQIFGCKMIIKILVSVMLKLPWKKSRLNIER